MTSSRLAAVGAMISILLLMWWLSSLGERLAQIEKTLSVVQTENSNCRRRSHARNRWTTCALVLTSLNPIS